MWELEIITKLSIIAIFVFMMCFIFIIDKVEKKKEIKENLAKEERKKKMELKRLEISKVESLEWNKDIQADTRKLKVLYKPSRNIKVLVGNYSNGIAVQTNTVLKKMGIETFFVPSAHNIIDKINAKEKYDIIITNSIYNRGETGEDIIRELKYEDRCDIPIVVLTIDQNARYEYVDNIGFDEYIAKPITIEKAIPVFEKVIQDISFEKIKEQ